MTTLEKLQSDMEGDAYFSLSLEERYDLLKRDAETIAKRLDALVAMLEPLEVGACPDCGGSGDFFVNALPPKGIVPTGSGYKIACETCDGHEDGRGSGVITFPDTSLHARAVAIAEGRTP